MNTKIILGMLVVSILLCSTISVSGNSALDTSTSNIQINKSSYDPSSKGSAGYDIVLNETFSTNLMPPTDWKLVQTHPSETWKIDSSFPHGEPYCATVHRGSSSGKQNESLITPQLNFTTYTGIINLSFWWYTSCYAAHWKDYIDLNVSISTDNESTWTLEWSDDDITSNYTSWFWFNKNIDLSKYANQSQVKIRFQYYSNVTTEPGAQACSIDDIMVYAENKTGEQFICHAGGPYEWCWETQGNYNPPGVRLHGAVENQSWWKCKWIWDFGDNTSTSNMPLVSIHDYKTAGIYNITLMVIDNASTPHRIDFDYTTILVYPEPEPALAISTKKVSLGIQATIENDGLFNATRVNWTMMVNWAIIWEKQVANGTIERLEPDSISAPIKSGYFFKFGFIRIEISVIPENMPGITKNYLGFKAGPLVYIIKET